MTRIATNQPFFLTRTRKDISCDFLDDCKNDSVDAIVLLCGAIGGDSGVDEMNKLIESIRRYDTSIPCFLLGYGTRVPNYDFNYYRSAKRDPVVRAFFDEIMKRSKAIMVNDNLTKDWLVNYFGYSESNIIVLCANSTESISVSIDLFWKKNDLYFEICKEDIFDFYNANLGRMQNSIFKEDYKKNVVISSPQIEYIDEKVRYFAYININGKGQKLWIETDRENYRYLVMDRADAFLIAVLQYAMRYNHNIVCNAPISAELMENITILMEYLLKGDDKLYKVEIMADIIYESVYGSGVGTAVSGGVDSFYTIARHFDTVNEASKLDCLYVGNYLYEGDAKNKIYKRAEDISSNLKLPLIKADSNVSKVFERYIPHIQYHIYKTFFGIYALRKRWGTYYFSSTFSLEDFSISNNSRKDCAYYEILLTSAFSISGCRVVLCGAEVDRFDKTAVIADFSPSYEHLNVCLHPQFDSNCSSCGKCVRTILDLEAAGKLDRFDKVFDLQSYRENRREVLLQMLREKDSPFYRRSYKVLKQREPELILELEGSLQETKM